MKGTHRRRRANAAQAPYETRSPKSLHEHPDHEALAPGPGAGYEELKQRMAREGRVPAPLVILPDGSVLCGRDSFRAAVELGLGEVSVEVRHDLADDPDEQLILIIDEHLARKDLTEAQRVGLVAARLDIERQRARERKIAGARRGGRLAGRGRRAPERSSGSRSRPNSGKVRDRVAELIGVSGRHFEKALEVLKAGAAGDAPVAALYEDDVVSASLAHAAIRRLTPSQQEQIVREVRATPRPDRARVARREIKALIDATETEDKSSPVLLSQLATALTALERLGSDRRGDRRIARAFAELSAPERATITRLVEEGGALIERLRAMLEVVERAPRAGKASWKSFHVDTPG